MTSQTAQDNVVIRVKTERDVPLSYCAGNHGIVNHTLDSPQLNGRVANADGFHHARQQMILKEETVQGNGSAFSQIEGTSRVVKQEAVEAETCSNIYGNRNKKAPVRSRSKSEGQIKPPQDNSLHDLRERTSPEKVKREYLNHVFRPGSVSRPENTFRAESASRPVPTRPEDIITSQPSLRGSESRLFQPEERIRNLHFEALKTPRGSTLYASDLSYPAKQVFNQFQLAPTMASNLAQNSSVMSQRGFTARRNDDLLPHHEQQQPFQRETNHAASSVYGNNGVPQQFMPNGDGSKAASGRFQEESRINGSPPDRPAQSPVSPQQNGSIPPEKNETKSTIHKKDEEPVWKTYQWYRDRKRPHPLQTKRQKAEQTIFMQYNEIRCKRVKEGRVVDVRRRASEPWFFPYSKETDQLPAKRARSPQEDTSQMSTIEHLASQPPQTLRCFSANQDISSIPPMEIRHLDSNVRARNSKRRNSEESHFNSKGNFHCACGREHGNISQEKTAKHVIFCHEKIKPRNQDYVTNSKEKSRLEIFANEDVVSTEHDDGASERISSTTEEDKLEVLPDKLRRYPQDVAKILRLNRIVKAVRNKSKRRVPFGSTRNEQQTVMKTRQCETNHDPIRHGVEVEVLSVGRHEIQLEIPSDSDQEIDQEIDQRCDNEDAPDQTIEQDEGDDDDEEEEEEEEERNSNGNFVDCFFHPDREPQQMRNGHANDLAALSQSISDQELFTARQFNGLGEMQARDDNDTVCQVNGLLSLPGFKETKFNISLGELKRRMNPPETLTRVEMISYVRQAKSSGRVLLDKNNIITANRSRPTILSRVCENEAQVLADGILKMNKEYLPLTTLARKTVEAYKDDDCKVKNCEDCRLKLRRQIVDVEITRNSLKELHKVIEETRKEEVFQTFELASHTFGVANILNHLSLLDDYFRTLLLTIQDD